MTDQSLGDALGRLNRATHRTHEVVTDGYEYRPYRVIEELSSELGYARPQRDFGKQQLTMDDLYPSYVPNQERAEWTLCNRRQTLLRVLGLAGGDPSDIAIVLEALGLEARDESYADRVDELNEQTRQHWIQRFQAGQAHLEASAYDKGRREVLEDLRKLTHSGILDTRGGDLRGLDADIHHEAEQAEAVPFADVFSLKTASDGQRVRIAGVFTELNVQTSIGAEAREWASGYLDDDTGRVEVLIFPNRYALIKDLVAVGAPAVVSGRADKRGGLRLMVTTVEPADARKEDA